MNTFLKYFCWKRTNSDITKVLLPLTLEEELVHISWKTCKTFVPPVHTGKVIKVYDGDTITIATKLPYDNTIYKFPVRLSGIDSAEIKGKTDHEKQLAVLARDALTAKILGKMVELRNVGTEKYGRLLADVYIDGVHINLWMLENKYAVAYNGGTKDPPESWNTVV